MQASNFGELGKNIIDVPIFIIFERIIHEEYSGHMHEIFIEKCTGMEDYPYRLIPNENDIGDIINRINELGICTSLRGASEFIYHECNMKGRLDVYEEIAKIAEVLDVEGEDSYMAEDIVDAAVSCFVDAVKSGLVQIVNLSELIIAESGLGKKMFIYKDYMYITDNLFKEILKPLTRVCRIGKVKSELLNAGILCGRQGNYTTKIRHLVDGKEERKRMLKLDLKNSPELESFEYK